MILDAATTDGSTILEPHLDNLLNVLFPQVRLEPSFRPDNNDILVLCHKIGVTMAQGI